VYWAQKDFTQLFLQWHEATKEPVLRVHVAHKLFLIVSDPGLVATILGACVTIARYTVHGACTSYLGLGSRLRGVRALGGPPIYPPDISHTPEAPPSTGSEVYISSLAALCCVNCHLSTQSYAYPCICITLGAEFQA